MANLIRLKQLDQADLSGFFNDAFVNTGLASKTYVDRFSDQTVSGIKTFANGVNLDGIDTLNLSGVDITITSGNVVLTNPLSAPNVLNIVYTSGNQIISGVKTFVNSGIFSLSGTSALSLPNNPLSIVGSGNTYIQVNIQNRSTGTNATADLVITANNGTDASNYIDLGINNSGYNDPNFSNGGAYDGYLFVNGGSLDIGTQTTGTNIEFHIGGTTAIRTIARITSDGLNIVSGALIASNLIYNTGNQTISGIKTFNLQPILSGNPLITGDLSLYVTTTTLSNTGSNLVNTINSLSGTVSKNFIATTGGYQDISGTKNFYTRMTVNGSGVRLYDEPVFATLPNTVVYTTGDQTLGGFKTFSSGIYSSNIVYNTGAQNISGVKTFIDSGIFSNGGVPAVALLNNPLSIVGSGTGYVQVNIQNRGTGFAASADLVITANNGTDNSNFINLGINNSGYSDPAFSNTTGLDGYLIMDGGDLDIGTRTPGKIIEFHAGGTTESNVIARISQTGLNIVSGNLTINGTGVLLTGQNSFILPFSNTSDTANTNTTYYFSNLDYGLRAVTGQAKVLALDNFIARKASWTIVASTFTPTTISTGYFYNFTKNTSGIISEVISVPATATAYNYGGTLNPPISVNINDEIGIAFKTGPSLNNWGHSGCRNLVNLYCYN